MTKEEFMAKTKEFEKKEEKKVKEAWELHRNFLEQFPFRQHPERIKSLTPEKLWNSGAYDCFFLWIYQKLIYLGHLRKQKPEVWENASRNLEKIKALLKISVDDSVSIAKKVDSPWQEIKNFGDDKMIAKKIIFCYYPTEVLPIFKTKHLEEFTSKLGIDFKKYAFSPSKREYRQLTLGEKFTHLNNLLLNFKKSEPQISKWDNVMLMRFLYTLFIPERVQYR